jgi:adenylate cyclase class IV
MHVGDPTRARENVEIKARDPDPAATLRACRALGAREEGLLLQRDTYFAVARGRLKLREHLPDGPAELIFYERPDEQGARRSRYLRVPVEQPARVGELLAAALGVARVVAKRRQLFLHGNVRIHVDEVEGLGSFVELESVLPPGGAETGREAAALAETVAALGLDARPTLPGSYADL